SETPWPRCAGRMWRVFTLLGLLCDAAGGKKPGAALKKIPARSFTMGGDELSGAPGTVQVSLQEYKIDETPVTNAHFRKFVRATKYRTDAEKFGWSFVINSSLSEAALLEAERAVQDAPQWVAVEGAWWRQPEGSDSKQRANWDEFPAVHISWTDAIAYCEWAGKRLPTEAEWENAARGKRKESLYPWDDARPTANGRWMMNIWQGPFPQEDLGEDGYRGLSPVKVGNVWEWTADPFRSRQSEEEQWTLKGGSFIDSVDGEFNHKATVVTRMGNTADSGSYNTGFRCATGKGGGGRKRPPDQKMLQKLAEEGGVEAVQEYLKKTGSDASVMTPEQLQKHRDRLKELQSEEL
ncbi:unnamed protein product, partial [Effrenium voratum]